MKRVRDILLAVVAVMMAVACGESRHISDTLQQAEAVMQEYPDSALTLLQAINPDELTTDRGRAMHALLLSQAYDKNYIDLTDDSLITIAVDYFAPTNDHHYAMLAHYYQGRVLYNANKLAESSVALINAENHALKINDDFYLGMIYAVMSSIDNYSYNFEEELKHALKSFEHYSKTTFDLHTAYAQLYLGRAYNNCHQFDKSSAIYKNVIENPIINQDTSTLCQAIQEYAHVKFVEKEYGTSKHMMLSVLNKYKQPIDAVEYGQLGYIYACENKLDSSLYYLSIGEKIMISQQDSASIARGKYNYYIAQNDYKNALKYEQEQIAIQNNSTKTVWQQAVVKSQRDYLDQKNKVIIAERKLQQTYAFIVLGALIILIISLIIYLRNKRIKVNAKIIKLQKILEWQKSNSEDQLKINNQTIRNLKEQLMQTTDKNSDLQIELKQKTIELAEANKLIQQQLQLKELADTNIRSSELYKMMRNFILHGKAVTSLEHWEKIFNLIDGFYPHFRDTLYSLCKISDIEIKVCVLIKIGFTPTEIAILTSSSKSNISSIRSRLYTKIFKKNGVSKDLDEFILSL